ncbi:hypothetical protein ACFORO_08595 [Amycolatopsis halotolerans]|uniref:Integral membrane protein n=1 Tax=Amycolatopsis halotolerans TaxID=330083 RepID=A0ABV7QFE6_9PSEU
MKESGIRHKPDAVPPRASSSGHRADLISVALALGLVFAAIVVGLYYNQPGSGVVIYAYAPPIFGDWLPHVGPGSLFAVLIAVLVGLWGPAVAARMAWRPLLALGYVLSLGWTMALVMVDGWTRGFTSRLTSDNEYLHEVPNIPDIPEMLRSFAGRILEGTPHYWTTHVSGHPPGATLVFVWLNRIGLGGGAWAATACVVVGCLSAVAVPATLSLFGRGDAARAALPFAVLTPGVIWIGASADGLFAGVTATGIAFLALAAAVFTRSRVRAAFASCAGGLLLGFGVFLSYGLVLFGFLAVAALILGKRWQIAAMAITTALLVAAVFALAGFWWFDGYQLVVQRYYQGIANLRPYSYWVWADIAAFLIACGPAVLAGTRRTVATGLLAVPKRSLLEDPVFLLVTGALLAVICSDVSGLSKAEVERIWLPFGTWLIAGTALLPPGSRRWWLAAQAVTALAVNHLVLTNW